ncbi:MAG: NAD-dependent DNA ligase LigA [Clostridia bacterium]|nr:NAD-dependent DNA ligase LigA [Clostridia bacterium]
MEFKIAKKKIKELTKIIKYHNELYYNQDAPEIEDFEYDDLMRQLKAIEKEYPELIADDSPTQKVGGKAKDLFSPVNHSVKMESLQDVFSFGELEDFCNKIDLDKTALSVEPKIDGLSVSLEYENGKFVRGSTRGDGEIGEDVTANLFEIKSIPKEIEYDGLLEVRGEVYMPKSSFLKLVERQELLGEQPAKNPRNAAAGSLRQKNSAVTASRNLDIFIFNIQRCDKVFSSHIQSLDFLKELGFNVLPSYLKVKNYNEAINEIIKIGDSRGNLSFDIDGAVIKVDDLEYRKLLGSTAKYPKWAVAYKYPPEEKDTVLRNIEINVGRTGALTPTAVFDPITLAGTTVSRAVLHNEDFINSKEIAIGDTITVRKAGEIIPEVLGVKKHCGSSVFAMPKTCPSCGAPVYREEGESVIRCTNVECPAQLLRHLIHFTSRDAMDIEGLGPAVLEQLLNAGLISNIIDIYTLDYSKVISLERTGEKTVNNLLNAINKSKDNDLYKLIFAFGIRHIGLKAAKIMAEKFKNIDAILNASLEDFIDIDGFGEIMAKSAYEFFSLNETRLTIEKLKELGINTESKSQVKDNRFAGLTFVLTGTLPTLTRSDATAIIESFGGKTSSSVSKKTDYVLAGDEAGSKLDKANSLGIKVIDENQFLSMTE